MNNHYGGVIWTNHVLKRLQERGISQSDAFITFNNPANSRHAATSGAWVFYRNFSKYRMEVVASQNEKKEWVIMSVWAKPLSRIYTKESSLTLMVNKFVQKLLEKTLGGLRKKFSKNK